MAAALGTATIVCVAVSYALEAMMVGETTEIAAASHGYVAGIYDSRRRTKSFSDDQWRSGPRQNGMKKEEKEKKKEPGSRQATYGTCYTCHGPIDISQRYRHWHDSSDYQCSRCSSTPPYPLDPPASIQQFHKLDQESRVGRKGMY
ncbi:hypothetical protein OIU78_010786 [Salix suchowensis]|nr:hypothetical protein OIU78_010786 [Salix suchowensis]